MPRLSIDITNEQHRRLEANAALTGQSIEDYVQGRSLAGTPDASRMSEETAFRKLEAILSVRLEEARHGDTVTTSAAEVSREGRRRLGR